jgi:benzoyl-CoA reductase subunit BamC
VNPQSAQREYSFSDERDFMKKIKINTDKCTGCRTCEVICSLTHDKGTINPRKSRIRVFKDDVDGVNLPLIARSHNQIEYVKSPSLTMDGKDCNVTQFWSRFKPSDVECDFCASCAKWCVTGALTVEEL